MLSRKDQQRISAQDHLNQRIELRHFFFCVIPEMNYLIRSNFANSQHWAYIKLNMVITKREATPPFPSKFYMSQIIEWYLQTGLIKRKILNKRAK